MTDDKRYGPADEGAAEGGESTAPELAHIARSGDAAKGDDERDPGDQVPDVLESAAELGLGAVIAPFTGGETVNIVGSVASMLEAGYDRLTHLGEHETPPEEAAAEPADDGPE
jgi:hypothetical protein